MLKMELYLGHINTTILHFIGVGNGVSDCLIRTVLHVIATVHKTVTVTVSGSVNTPLS